MKLGKRILASLLVFTLVAGCITGCGNGDKKKDKAGTSKTDIQINVWNAGLGVAWLDALIEGFKKVHPEYNVTYTATASESAVTTSLGLEDIDIVDLYFGTKVYDTTYLEPLNELLDSTAEGDTMPLREKFEDYYLELETASDGNVYSLTQGGGVIGIVYNKELFEKAGIEQLPRTTNELAIVCNTLYTKNITPICHFKAGGYYHFIEESWYGQYEGMDYYKNTFYLNPTKDILLTQDGRYEMLKALEKVITPDYVLSGSNSSDHTTMQTKFLLGEAAMMINGSWLANEMSANAQVDNFRTMKLPVLSGITSKLTTVTKESDLRKVITAIDAVTDGEADITAYQKGADYEVEGLTVSAADWDYLFTARNTIADNYAGHAAMIPTYASAKEGAKEFLKYMYSDAGYKIYLDTLHIELPLKLCSGEVDMSEWTEFEIGQSTLLATAVQSFSASNRFKHAIFQDGGAKLLADVSHIAEFCSKNPSDRMTADEIWAKITKTINDKYETTWLANIE